MSTFNRTKTPGVYFKETRAGRTYYIDYVDDEKRRRREKAGPDYEGAKSALALILNKRTHGETVHGRVDVVFADYAEQWIESRLATKKIKENSAKLYRGHLSTNINPVIGKKKLGKITKHDVLGVVQRAELKHLAPWTINTIIAVMSGAFKAAQWEYGIANPVAQLLAEHRPGKKAKRRMHVLDPREIDMLLVAAKNTPSDRTSTDPGWVEPLLALGIYSGLRQSELLGLWWEDLDLTGDVPTVRVHAQLSRNGRERLPYLKSKDEGVERVVEIPRWVAKLLVEWKLKSTHSTATSYVFAQRDGMPVSQSWARRRFIDLRDLCGIQADLLEGERCHFHDMRDTFASILIDGGATVVEVQHALGHERASTTLDTYAHLWNLQERKGKLRDILEAASL